MSNILTPDSDSTSPSISVEPSSSPSSRDVGILLVDWPRSS